MAKSTRYKQKNIIDSYHAGIEFKLNLLSIYKAKVEFYVCESIFNYSDINRVKCRLMNLTNNCATIDKNIKFYQSNQSLVDIKNFNWMKFSFEFDFQTNIFDLIFNPKYNKNNQFNYLSTNENNDHDDKSIDTYTMKNKYTSTSALHFQFRVKYNDYYIYQWSRHGIASNFASNNSNIIINFTRNTYLSLSYLHAKFKWFVKTREIICQCYNNTGNNNGWIGMILFKYIDMTNIENDYYCDIENESEFELFEFKNNSASYRDCDDETCDDGETSECDTECDSESTWTERLTLDNWKKESNVIYRSNKRISNAFSNCYGDNDVLNTKTSKNKHKSTLIKKRLYQKRNNLTKFGKTKNLKKQDKKIYNKNKNKNKKADHKQIKRKKNKKNKKRKNNNSLRNRKYKEKYVTQWDDDDYLYVYVAEPAIKQYEQFLENQREWRCIERDPRRLARLVELENQIILNQLEREERANYIQEISQYDKLCDMSMEYNAEYVRKRISNKYNSMIVKKKYQLRIQRKCKQQLQLKKISKHKINKLNNKAKKYNRHLQLKSTQYC